MRFVKIILAFIAAAVVAGLLGTFLSTQFVIAGLDGVGAGVAMDERVAMTLFDLQGMGPIYTIVMAIGLAVGFVNAALLLMVLPLPRWAGYAIAGAAVVVTMLMLMQQAYWGTMPIAGARTLAGYLAQLAAGAIGGLVFAALLPRRRAAAAAA